MAFSEKSEQLVVGAVLLKIKNTIGEVKENANYY